MKKVVFSAGLLLLLNFPVLGDALDTWTKVVTSTNSVSYSGIAFGDGVFVVTTFHGGCTYKDPSQFLTSADGKSWSLTTVTNVTVNALTFGNGTFVAAAADPGTCADGGVFYYSTNGRNWTPADPGGTAGDTGITYGKGIFVAVGYYYEIGSSFSCTSSDGVNWGGVVSPVTTNYLYSVAYGNNEFIAVGGPYYPFGVRAEVMTSADGTNWTKRANSLPGDLVNIQFVNGAFYGIVRTATSSNYVLNTYTTTAGTTWTKLTTPRPGTWVPTTGGNGIYVNVDTGGAVRTSTDGTVWVSRNTGLTNDLFGVAYGNNVLVAAGADGSLFQSGSAMPSLAGQPAPGNGGFQISLSGGIAPNWRLLASTNLTNWGNLFTFTNIEANAQYLDTNAGNFQQHYYRAVSP